MSAYMYAHENWVTEFQTVQFFLQTQISVVHTLCMNITGKQIQDTYVFWRSFEVLKKKKEFPEQPNQQFCLLLIV